MKTATFVRDIEGWTGDARLYELSEPILYNEPWDEDDDTPAEETLFVIVSATYALFSGPETYIFPANKDGEVLDWGELNGSFRGGLDHERALSGAGYSIKNMTIGLKK